MSNVGFIGLGIMGGPMALNVRRGGHRLAVFDVDPAAVARLVAGGATAAASPAAVAAASDVVITMLPDSPDVERVALGPDGLRDGFRQGAVYIDMSTIDPLTSRRVGAELAGRGVEMIDSPVGKTAEHAVKGTLTLMVGGRAETVARVRPILDLMGTDFFHCGELGAGHAMKLVNNLLATALVAVNSECLTAGVKAGLTLEVMTSVMKTTMAWNNQLAIAMPARPFKGDFEAGFMLRLAHKDCRLAAGMIEALGVAGPVGKATLAVCQEGLDKGLGQKDVGVILQMREEPAGVAVRTSA
jgi:3-hydroxyisobutyrate dehydrogenase-like beta-hydroxyacid dehydrogenase